MAVQFEVSRFPVVTMTFSGDVVEADITQAGMQLLGVLQRKRGFVLISDMRAAAPSAHQGRMLTALMDKKRDEFRTYLRANILVVDNLVVRAALRAALLVAKPPFPVQIETSILMADTVANTLTGQAA